MNYKWKIINNKNPFSILVDLNNNNINIDLIGVRTLPINYDKMIFNYKCKGYYFIGISSYQNFPEKIINPGDTQNTRNYNIFENDIFKDCLIGWCTCSKNTNFIPNNIKHIRLPESDFMNPLIYKPDNIKKEYDFIYNCQKGKWQNFCRNWELAEKCIDIMINKYNLKIVLIGKKGDINEPKHKNIISTFLLPKNKFKEYLQKSKYIFVPNIYDASPRVVSQAMLYNLPVLENKNIYGGWHYINKNTGMSFTNIDDFEQTLIKFLKKKDYKPREWFIQNYGLKNSSERLYNFVNTLEKPLYYSNKNAFNRFDLIIGINYLPNFNTTCKQISINITNYSQLFFNLQQFNNNLILILQKPCKITNKFNHYINLMLDLIKNNLDIIFLNGNGSLKQEKSEYTYMSQYQKITNCSAFIINTKFLNKFIKSDINFTNILYGYLFDKLIIDRCKKGNLINKSISFIKKINDLFIFYNDNNIYKYSKGYFQQTELNTWTEYKNGSIWCTFEQLTNNKTELLLFDKNRGYYVKINKNNNKCFYSKKETPDKFYKLFDCLFINYKWMYDFNNIRFEYVKYKNIWEKYENDNLIMEFNEYSKNNDSIIIYNNNNKLYIKLTLKDCYTSKSTIKWIYESSGYITF